RAPGGERLMAELSSKELLYRATLELRSLKARIAELERPRTVDPTVVIGMSGRFANATNLDDYWRLMRDGVDATSDAPDDRPGLRELYDPDPDVPNRVYTTRGGFLPSALSFEPKAFGIAARDAVAMDPQHALLLEVASDALEDAG